MEDEDDLDDASIEELKRNVPLDPTLAAVRNQEKVAETPAERISEADAKLKEERATQAKQNTLWRRFLFWGVSAIVVLIALANVVFIGWYMTMPDASPIVLSTWVAGGAVQVVGLLVVITKHLFPGENSR
ncbi:hypothetical protein ABE10_25395 [Bacillus toyonensis]|nr:hypothetical protein [Bacillus toyonensis]